jgi:hypothetical protein
MFKNVLVFNKKPEKYDYEIKIITSCGEKVIFFVINKNNKIELFFDYEASQLISYSANLLCSIISEAECIDFGITRNKFFESLNLKLSGSRKKTIEYMIDKFLWSYSQKFIQNSKNIL